MSRFLALLALVAPVLAGCGATSEERPQIVTGFYPLQYVAQRIAGDHAQVTSLVAPGVEPHDVELSPRQVADLAGADVVVYERGFQPALDEAVSNDRPEHVVDASSVVRLRTENGYPDPHFWLDPTLLADLAGAVASELSRALPEFADQFAAADRRLQQDLRGLDRSFREGLASCRTRTVVVSHNAFGYLGDRYRLEVHAIAGISPSSEPSPKHLAELRALVREKDVTTVFSERLVSPELAETLADEAGVGTAVLDPLEGLSAATADQDYLSLMRANLAALRKAGGCR